jgi:phosphomannomutase
MGGNMNESKNDMSDSADSVRSLIAELGSKEKMVDRYSKIFGAYDIRGIVGKEIDSLMVRDISRAFGEYLCSQRIGHFLIGHDNRWSSAAFAEAASFGLREYGHKVTHIGLASTPLIYWYGAEGGFDGSIAISASHLPPNYNGLKLCTRDALPLSSEHGLPEIADILRKPWSAPSHQCGEVVRYVSPLAEYAREIRRHLKPVRPLRVAVDAGNGLGGMATEVVFAPIDTVELWRLNFHQDSKFPARPSNPLEPAALDQLASVVKKHGLDFGLAFDGDADRAIVVDEQGKMVLPDAIGGLIAVYTLKIAPGATILHDLRVSRAIPERIKAADGQSVRSRVGHAFIKRAMREHNAIFAMELSGHYYYADLHYTDSGQRTLVELINIVSAENKPLSSLVKPFEIYPTSGEINLEVTDRAGLLAGLEARHRDGKLDHLDGVSVDYPDWWFNVRPSNTESLVRINIGAINAATLGEKRRSLLNEVDELSAQSKMESSKSFNKTS